MPPVTFKKQLPAENLFHNSACLGRTWLANVRWNADLSGLRSLNWSRPTSPSAATVSCADSAGSISCAAGRLSTARLPRLSRADATIQAENQACHVAVIPA